MLGFSEAVTVWVFNLNLLTGNIMKKTGCHVLMVGFCCAKIKLFLSLFDVLMPGLANVR